MIRYDVIDTEDHSTVAGYEDWRVAASVAAELNRHWQPRRFTIVKRVSIEVGTDNGSKEVEEFMNEFSWCVGLFDMPYSPTKRPAPVAAAQS